jgi:hypothetical protein
MITRSPSDMAEGCDLALKQPSELVDTAHGECDILFVGRTSVRAVLRSRLRQALGDRGLCV